MKVILKSTLLIAIPESATERDEIEQWKLGLEQHVFLVRPNSGEGLALGDLGPREHACHEPINIRSDSSDPAARLISNFAPTPFLLDEESYESVEGFWQSLKFEKRADRLRVAQLSGGAARRAGQERDYGEVITCEGRSIRVGTWEHWQLMERACWAKFTQHEAARAALLSTAERPLVHRMRRDSRTIPGVIMADIWMRTRRKLRNQQDEDGEEEVE